MAILDGTHKLIVAEQVPNRVLEPEAGWWAFALETDPGELDDLSEQDVGWPELLLKRLGPRAEAALEPMEEAAPAHLDAAHMDELRALGYVGDGD